MNPPSSSSPSTSTALIHRFQAAYREAAVLEVCGMVVRILGIFVAVAIFMVGLSKTEPVQIPSQADLAILGVYAAYAAASWLALFLAGTLAGSFSAMVRSTIDSAVFTCPFLSDQDCASALERH